MGTVRMRPVLAAEIDDDPASFPLLDVIEGETGHFRTAQRAADQSRQDGAIPRAFQGPDVGEPEQVSRGTEIADFGSNVFNTFLRFKGFVTTLKSRICAFESAPAQVWCKTWKEKSDRARARGQRALAPF
jgi:hypothetical protein